MKTAKGQWYTRTAEDRLVNRSVYRSHVEPRPLNAVLAAPDTSRQFSEIDQGYGVACDPVGIDDGHRWMGRKSCCF
jgi:hypothetical protein